MLTGVMVPMYDDPTETITGKQADENDSRLVLD
jgi:hypothetical protein